MSMKNDNNNYHSEIKNQENLIQNYIIQFMKKVVSDPGYRAVCYLGNKNFAIKSTVLDNYVAHI